MRTTATALILAAGMATAAVSVAEADDFDHDLGRAGDGVPLSAILMRLETLGYRHVSAIDYLDGVWSVRGRMADGSVFALSIDARTGEPAL